MTYKIIWTPEAQKDLASWKIKDKSILIKIKDLIETIKQEPKYGIGKPEKIKYQDQNIWSRRIDKKNRLVYLIDNDVTIFVIQCRFDYDN